MDTQELIITQTEDGMRIENAPLPEHITIGRKLWNQILTEAPPAGDEPAADDPRWAWLELINHADPDREHDGWMLHLDATNVQALYRVAAGVPDDAQEIPAELASWGEK